MKTALFIFATLMSLSFANAACKDAAKGDLSKKNPSRHAGLLPGSTSTSGNSGSGVG